jgi:hypothetical protein
LQENIRSVEEGVLDALVDFIEKRKIPPRLLERGFKHDVLSNTEAFNKKLQTVKADEIGAVLAAAAEYFEANRELESTKEKLKLALQRLTKMWGVLGEQRKLVNRLK